MMKLNLNREKKFWQNTVKKFRGTHPYWYIIGFLILLLTSFYIGNFLDNSNFVKNTNIFNMWFGETIIEITEHYNPLVSKEGTTIYFDIANVGDKDIDNLNILYTFCGLDQQKVQTEVRKLRSTDVPEEFSIFVPLPLDLNCSISTDKIDIDIYEDGQRKCYLDIKDKVSNVCKYCKIKFEIYGNGQQIEHDPIWYPYLYEPTDVGKMTRLLLVQYPLWLKWKDSHASTCEILSKDSPKTGLVYRETIWTTLYDIQTMCLRGDDLTWCKENYYQK